MGNRYFKRSSGVFACRRCGRSTRDTTGDNGSARLCEDCYDGCGQENGYLNSAEGPDKEQYERDMRACFQRAVDKGGAISGYTRSGS